MSNDFYRIDSRSITLREYRWGSPLPVALLGWSLRFLNVRVPGSTDDLNVQSLQGFEIEPTALPPDVVHRFQPLAAALTEAGFHSPVYRQVIDLFHSTTSHLATFQHSSGQVLARIRLRQWKIRHPAKVFFFVEFISGFSDGTFLISSSAKPDLLAPASVTTNYLVGAAPAALWASHQEIFSTAQWGKTPLPVATPEQTARLEENLHAALRDFHVARGVFRPMAAKDHQRRAAIQESHQNLTSDSQEHAEVIAEIDRLQRRQTGWIAAVLTLVISLAVFAGATAAHWSWDLLLLLIPILLFHELGHYVAMRVFRYRNLKMFFIPFLGAAVSGQNYSAPGWKKALVALMGPLPGIALGLLLGVVGVITGQAFWFEACLLTLILNGFNLLPFFPLDGGRVMQTLLFSRHYLLDVAFRVLACLGLFGLGMLFHDMVLRILSIAMLMGIPAAYRLGKVAHALRKTPLLLPTTDEQIIPAELARVIVGPVKQAFPRGLSIKVLAQHCLYVYEAVNARPPGWLASLGLMALYGGAFVTAIMGAGVFMVLQTADFGALAARYEPKFADVSQMETWNSESPPSADVQNVLVAEFPDDHQARLTFQELGPALPPGTAMTLLGRTVLVGFDTDDTAVCQPIVKRLDGQAVVHVNHAIVVNSLHLKCRAPDTLVAHHIEQEVQEYQSAFAQAALIPPWIPSDTRTDAQRSEHREARRLWSRLQKAEAMRSINLDHAELNQPMPKPGDVKKMAEFMAAMQEMIKSRRETELVRVREEDPSPRRLALIDAWAATVAATESVDQAEQQQLAAGAYMGQLPLLSGQVAPGAQSWSCLGGAVHCDELEMSFVFWPNSPCHAAPAIVQWLKSKGCTQFRYAIQTYNSPDSENLAAD